MESLLTIENPESHLNSHQKLKTKIIKSCTIKVSFNKFVS